MENILSENVINMYKCGLCYPMAISLSNQFELPIKALVVDLPGDKQVEAYQHVVHAFINGKEDFDIGGELTEEDLKKFYLEGCNRKFSNERFITFENSQDFYQYLIDIHVGFLRRHLENDMAFIDNELNNSNKYAKIFFDQYPHLHKDIPSLKF